MVLFPDSPAPVGTDGGGKLVSVSLGERGRGQRGKACERVGDPGTWWCQLGDQVSPGASGEGELAEGGCGVAGVGG